MSYYRPSEIAAILNIQRTKIYTYQQRDQLKLIPGIKIKGQTIDMENPINELFLAKKFNISTPTEESLYIKNNTKKNHNDENLFFDSMDKENAFFLDKYGLTADAFEKKAFEFYKDQLKKKMAKFISQKSIDYDS